MATDYKLRITAQDKSKKGFNSVNKNINSTQSAMKKLAGAFAGAFAIRQIVQFGNEALELADSVGKVADKLGVTTDFLQRMQFAAEQTGIAQNTLNMGLQRFIRRVAEARNGTGEAKAALEQLGIALNDSEGNARSIEDILADVSDGLANTADSGEKVRLAFKFFDSEGVSLVSTLGDGSEALKEMMKSATGVIPEETVRQAERFNDTMNRLKREILTPLQARIVDVANSFLDFLDAMGLISAETKSLTLLTYDLEKAQLRLEEVQNRLAAGNLGQGKRAAKQKEDNLKAEIVALEKLIAEKKKEQEEEEKKRQKYNLTFTELDDKSANFNENIKNNITVVKQFANTIEGQLTTAFTNFFDATNQQFLDFKNLATSITQAVINELIQVFIVQKMVEGITSGITMIGSIFDGSLAKAVDGIQNLDGGGYTGNGIRAGGLDGKGGRLAMIHPQETVIDHTKGQAIQSAPTVNFNISTVDAAGFDQLLASRKGLITSIINNAMNNQGKMGVV